ncbi:MAG: ScyD/ScyE family protein [bacterium]|nr:ScyD/ScyE family protein [bacterium]
MKPANSKRRWPACALALVLVMASCDGSTSDVPIDQAEAPTVEVVAEGLVNPLGLAALPDGSILIAEEGTGERDTSAGLSVLTPDGKVGRVVSDLPSSRDSGDLSGAPLAGVSPDGSTAYVAHFASQALLTLPIPPDGLKPETKAAPALTLSDLTPTMTPLREVALLNPFDIAFDEAGRPVVTDASANGVATVNNDGTTTFTHRISELEDPGKPTLKIDPVPTGITRVGDEYYVTLTGGCPYPQGSGVVVALGADRAERVVATDLNMPIDVELGPSGTIWLLEFARFTPDASCFTGAGYEAGTGRLSRLHEDGTRTEVLSGLNHPGAVVEMPNGDVYVTEIFSGRVLRLSWPSSTAPAAAAPTISPPSAATPEWGFANVAAAVGLDFTHGAFATELSEDPAAAMGGGLCWIDYDRDGWLDLYLVNSHAATEVDYWAGNGGLPRNELYRNDGGTFSRVGSDAGVDIAHRGNGCVSADFDGDGWYDLFVTADGPNSLFHNQGDGSFIDVAAAAGVDTPEWNSAAVVGDLNGDSRPDLFVGAYIDLAFKIDKPSGAFPQDYLGLPDRLFINQGQPGVIDFREVADASGLEHSERALGALLSDFDLDGDLDLYIANDGHPNRLYRNDSTHGSASITLTDVTAETGVGDSGSGMGVAGGDYDGNGAFDLLVTNWEAELNALYANESSAGGFAFGYMTQRIGLAGLGNNKTGWGVAWVDVDHDTDLDMLIAHGRVPVTNMETDPELVRLYGNLLAEGQPGQFRDWTTQSGLDVVGPLLARGSAAADFDNDGDVDIAINSIGGSVALLRSDGTSGNWIEIDLGGFHPGALAKVALADGRILHRELHAGSSYLASEDSRIHFGLGSHPEPVPVTIVMPDGTVIDLGELAPDQIHTIVTGS